MSSEFSLYWWNPDGFDHKELSFVDAETAFNRARSLIDSPAAEYLNVVRRIMITDGDDFCVFEWKHGEGVVFPVRGATHG